jgi:hypothetical protein
MTSLAIDTALSPSLLSGSDPVQTQAEDLLASARGPGGSVDTQALAAGLAEPQNAATPGLLGAVTGLLSPTDQGRLGSDLAVVGLPQAKTAATVENLSGSLAPVTSIGGLGALVGHSLETPGQRQSREMQDNLDDQAQSQMVGQAQMDEVLEPYVKTDRAPVLTPAAQSTQSVVDRDPAELAQQQRR